MKENIGTQKKLDQNPWWGYKKEIFDEKRTFWNFMKLLILLL
jgi:hypothetical protein